LFKTYDALAAGAVDVLEKPRGDEPDGEWEQRFRSAVKLVSRIKVITHPRARLRAYGGGLRPPPRAAPGAPAPPGQHLTIASRRFYLTSAPPRHSCRPSIDVLFESVSREYGASVAAALLTGMGRDGAAGLLEIRKAGGVTIAQDETTSVVYGMPREAVLLGAAERVLPLQSIGGVLAA